MDAVASDIGFQAAKTGMLLNADIIEAVANTLLCLQFKTLVVDPVMVSRTGAQLIDNAAIATLTQTLIPQALIVTPNRYEAQILASLEIDSLETMKAAAQKIYTLGPSAVLVKGGGMMGALKGVDVWFDGEDLQVLETAFVDTPHTHGTGCTLSAAITANLSLGKQPFDAVQSAKQYVTEALKHALAIGQGQGPVGHWFALL
jgi:hydroxymethylpyrimidine/phosphomethylpyrimidine kinase